MQVLQYKLVGEREYILLKAEHATPQYIHIVRDTEGKILARIPISAPTDWNACDFANDYIKANW